MRVMADGHDFECSGACRLLLVADVACILILGK
jgi:hypothetical protein